MLYNCTLWEVIPPIIKKNVYNSIAGICKYKNKIKREMKFLIKWDISIKIYIQEVFKRYFKSVLRKDNTSQYASMIPINILYRYSFCDVLYLELTRKKMSCKMRK